MNIPKENILDRIKECINPNALSVIGKYIKANGKQYALNDVWEMINALEERAAFIVKEYKEQEQRMKLYFGI